MGGKERFFASLFQAVTPRTAGFNTTDLTELSDTGKVVMIILMLIGGSPGLDCRWNEDDDYRCSRIVVSRRFQQKRVRSLFR